MTNSNARRTPWWVVVSVIAAAGLALASLSFRYRAECANRAAGLCMEMQAVKDLGAGSGVETPDALVLLKAKGLTGVALNEESVSDLAERGEVSLRPGLSGTTIVSGLPSSVARVRRGAQLRGMRVSAGPTPTVWASPDQVLLCAVGLNPRDCEVVRATGLTLVARHANVVGAGPATVRGTLAWSKALGATVYLPLGEQVLGQRDLIDATVDALNELGYVYASPEFAKIGGDLAVRNKAPERVVRLHSIQQAEVDKMRASEVVDRFVKAFRERGIRWLLLRPMSMASENPLGAASDALAKVRVGIERQGGAVRVPRPFQWPDVAQPLFALIGLAAAPAIAWAASSLFSGWVLSAAWVVAVLLGAACYVPSARPYQALLAGIAFPIVAYMALLRRAKVSPLVDYLMVSAISLAGGLCIGGLLNALPYAIQAKQFTGVKMAHFLPIPVIGYLVLREQASVKEIIKRPVVWETAILGLLVVAAIGFMLARTGNDNPEAVSGMELKMRALMDTVLPVRPRTKEFLLGNPALWIGLTLFAEWRRRPEAKTLGSWAVVLLAAGAIGQTSIVNTMCHVHSPFSLGIERIAIGLVLGGIVGAAATALVRPWVRRAAGGEG